MDTDIMIELTKITKENLERFFGFGLFRTYYASMGQLKKVIFMERPIIANDWISKNNVGRGNHD